MAGEQLRNLLRGSSPVAVGSVDGDQTGRLSLYPHSKRRHYRADQLQDAEQVRSGTQPSVAPCS